MDIDSCIYFQVVLKEGKDCEAVGYKFGTLKMAVEGLPETLTEYARDHGRKACEILISAYFVANHTHGSMWIADYSKKGEFLDCLTALKGPGPRDPDNPKNKKKPKADSIPGSKDTRCFEITVEQLTKVIHCDQITTNAPGIAAAECIRHRIADKHGKEGDKFNIVDIEEIYKEGDVMFYVVDDNKGYWVELLSSAQPFADNEEEEVINDYLVKAVNREDNDVDDFFVPHDMLTNVPFRVGFNKAGQEADPENIHYFPDSGHASDHLDNWFEGVPVDEAYSAHEKKQLADLLDGKSNVAMLKEHIYWVEPVKKPS